MNRPIYLDCNATTPLEREVVEAVHQYLESDFGNAGSRSHEYGNHARQAVQHSRDQIASALGASPNEVIFTSGATESNNLAILGLASHGFQTGKKHLVTSAIEHKSILEPFSELEKRGFTVTLVPVTKAGWVDVDEFIAAIREDTLLASVMQVNNETGVKQPISSISEKLQGHPVYLHVDAAQGFGKDIKVLRDFRIDLISISSHKIYGPKGIGALLTRHRDFCRPPLEPLLFGGGQEYGLRAGTVPVHQVVGMGVATELAMKDSDIRAAKCLRYRKRVLEALSPLDPILNGAQDLVLPHVLNISFPGIDSEAIILALREEVAISNGSACTSASYEPSHVLRAMSLPEGITNSAIRLSWCHLTEHPDWDKVVEIIQRLR